MKWKLFAVSMGVANCLGIAVIFVESEYPGIFQYFDYSIGLLAAVILILYAFNIAILDLRVLSILSKIMNGYFVLTITSMFWKAYWMLGKIPLAYILLSILIAAAINVLMWIAVWRYCSGLTSKTSVIS
ncbi:hypothetical protein ACCS95_37570 [Rhizobium ruizarguesonis]